MNSKFLQLDKEKQDRIINAALKIFSQTDYKNASTDDIVKEAGISKGSLFFYFKNKKMLFEFLFHYVVDYLSEKVMNIIDFSERDLLNRLKQVLIYKMTIINQYPDMINFMLKANQENSEELDVDLMSKGKQMSSKTYSIFFENIDYSLFREDIDINLAINTILWSSEGFSNQNLAVLKNKIIEQNELNKLLEEFGKYLDLFRKCYYKGGI